MKRSLGRWRVEEDGRVFGPDNKPALLWDLPYDEVVLDDYRPVGSKFVIFNTQAVSDEDLRILGIFLRPESELIHG